MFVVKNAWSTLKRHPWRTTLTCIVTLIITTTTVFSTAVVEAADNASGSEYQALKPVVALHRTAATEAKRDGADPDWTKNYLTWTDYTNYATAAQQANLQFSYTLTISMPARQTDKFKAIAGTADQSADKTGGEFTLTGFYTQGAQDSNPAGAITIVDGKALNYDSSNTATDEVLISKAIADANNLKVGDSITVANPTNADTAYTFKIQGIYTYNDTAASGEGSDAKLAKDNRDNAIYMTYTAFAGSNLDTSDGTGWSIPDLDIQFTLNSAADYDTFVKAVEDAKLPDTYEIVSSTLTDYKASIAPLESLANGMRIARIVVLVLGGLALLALVIVSMRHRTSELGTALTVGMTRGRMGRQFMLEVLIPTFLGFLLGMLVAGFATNPLAKALVNHDAPVSFGLLLHVFWYALATYVVLSCIVVGRAAAFRTTTLFAPREYASALLENTDDDATTGDSASTSVDTSAEDSGTTVDTENSDSNVESTDATVAHDSEEA
ncbi:ABC transporter permease [Bifidobacterium tsurumiense]|uniref:ABC transporter permease n=1 Tax=Bifidobacterium tsurumiense TaxID=356829 RepID=UPI0012B424F9|nr:ABC transporter permease [Bifidobacterium tsurumiense]MSS13370.1 ABC transporter permease [Bifidobacterium tsurumiense]